MPDRNENFESMYENPFLNHNYNKDYLYDDGVSLTYDPSYASDMSDNGDGTLNLSKEIVNSRVPGGMGDDHIILNLSNKNGFWKYNEEKILKEIRDYIGSTYSGHYTSKETKTQTLDLIESIGDAESFCRSNAIKYLSRFGKKNGKSKLDLLKVIHYSILLYHFAGFCNENEEPYETF